MPSGLFIISAPSGSGKSTLVAELFRQVPGLRFSISYTTRAPRGSERNGVEYFFVDRAHFEAMITAGDFLEHAEVFGNYYGTARSFLEDARRENMDLVLDIDVQGACQVRANCPDAVSIFIAPPNFQTLTWRLENRGLDSPAVIAQRLFKASNEIAAYNVYDYVVINGDLTESVEQLCATVRWERARQSGHTESSEAQTWRRLADAGRQDKVAPRLRSVLASFGLAKEETRI